MIFSIVHSVPNRQPKTKRARILFICTHYNIGIGCLIWNVIIETLAILLEGKDSLYMQHTIWKLYKFYLINLTHYKCHKKDQLVVLFGTTKYRHLHSRLKMDRPESIIVEVPQAKEGHEGCCLSKTHLPQGFARNSHWMLEGFGLWHFGNACQFTDRRRSNHRAPFF